MSLSEFNILQALAYPPEGHGAVVGKWHVWPHAARYYPNLRHVILDAQFELRGDKFSFDVMYSPDLSD